MKYDQWFKVKYLIEPSRVNKFLILLLTIIIRDVNRAGPNAGRAVLGPNFLNPGCLNRAGPGRTIS